MEFLPDRHLARIDESIRELSDLEVRTSSPAHVSHQYIGTVVDNTIALLTAPANSLDGGHRLVTISDPKNWVSIMQAVHRSFFSSVHLATERALAELCEGRLVTVQSGLALKLDKEISSLLEMIDDDATIQQVRRLKKSLPRFRSSFDDYLNAVLEWSDLSRERKRSWRKYFGALSIVRNRISHSDPTLSTKEAQSLRDGGCGVMVSNDGSLVVNPRMYKQVASHILDFLDQLVGT